ncbi:MAG: DUF1127 domain-containing protein [Alphaproteobacteria bacterium]|nr:DUF1127 domain-containing protein [Alphaproteobacteria bacterium]
MEPVRSLNSIAEGWSPYRPRFSAARIAAGIRAYFASQRARLRRAERELGMLDDRMLRDIGLDRGAIHCAVRWGRDH